MTVEADIFALLGPLVGNRVFPDVAPLSTTRPYVTWQRIGGPAINYMSNEIPTHEHVFVQVNTWADSRLSVSALAKQIEDAFRGATAFQATPDSGHIATYDLDLNLYGTIQDFSVFAAR